MRHQRAGGSVNCRPANTSLTEESIIVAVFATRTEIEMAAWEWTGERQGNALTTLLERWPPLYSTSIVCESVAVRVCVRWVA